MNNLWERVVSVLEGYGDKPEDIKAVWVALGRSNLGRRLMKDEWRPFFEVQPDGSGYGGTECTAFHLYSKNALLFMVEYDGSERVGSIPRKPSKSRKVDHIG